jgi:hypothetical protein
MNPTPTLAEIRGEMLEMKGTGHYLYESHSNATIIEA